MSFKKSKLDLLVRVRYQNPLPPPPFPPKLLNIPTHPSRYATPDFTAALVAETPLPMVVDAECGMPLDLCWYDSIWGEGGDDSELNPDPHNKPPIDPKDAFMLDSSTGPASYTNGSSSSAQSALPHVAWLRKTEYLSRESSTRSQTQQDLKHLSEKPIDISRSAQIRDIEGSFPSSSQEFDLSQLRHPNKPEITAVESYEILPDVRIWANAYDLFRFSERPGERASEAYDPRLDCAILRPMESDGDHFLAYYLPDEDETALQFKTKRETNEEVDEETIFSFVRDYETMKIEQDVPNEFLLVLDDGDEELSMNGNSSAEQVQRSKGAYYKGIERKIMLKKKRVNQWENVSYTEKWDAINLTMAPYNPEERDEREEATAEVLDPLYMFSRIDADAEGEVDETVPTEGIQAAEVFGDD